MYRPRRFFPSGDAVHLLRGRLRRTVWASPPSRRAEASLIPFGWIRRKQEVPQAALESAAPLERDLAEERQMEKFIPVTRRALVRKLVEEEGLLSWGERHHVDTLAASLDAYFSQRFYSILEEAKHLYDCMDPDKDTITVRPISRKELLDREYWLLQRVEKLLDKANYFEIPTPQLHGMLKDRDIEGLRVSVDPTAYETLRIWTRGKSVVKTSRLRRIMRGDFGFKACQEVYTRVFLAVRCKSSTKLHLKAFKEVPCNKLEYLLPEGKIRMSKFDKSFLGTSLLVASAFITLKSLPVMADYKLEWTWTGLAVAGLIGARAWIGYKNKRNKYLVNLATTLYYKTVSNNRGVLTLLADRAQDEEFKEAILAYLFLLSPHNRRGIAGTAHTADSPMYDTPDSLQQRVEEWLLKVFGLRGIGFDITDALDKLDNLGLLTRHKNGSLSVQNIEDALATLPEPTHQWQYLGALRDSESSDELNLAS